MLELSRKQQGFSYPFTLSFTFERGEHKGERYQGHSEICGNPLCTCQDVEFVVENVDRDSPGDARDSERYAFFLDVIEKGVSDRKGHVPSTISNCSR